MFLRTTLAGEVVLMKHSVRVQLVRDASAPKKKITSAKEVVALCKDMRQLDREHFRALYLDSRNGLLGVETVAIGSLNATMVHPREVFKAAILLNAAALVLVHNHPSGEMEPSDEDLAITKTLKACGELLGIEMVDHVIVGGRGWKSVMESETASETRR